MLGEKFLPFPHTNLNGYGIYQISGWTRITKRI